MKDTIKKIINFRFDRYHDTEIRLEKLAEKGLFLVECGTFAWTFRRGEPKNLHYTITFFSEGSLFNPGITENQHTYFDYAKAAGWDFVTQSNQMQIFSSEAEEPVPFETDEREKFENLKKCMNKSFLPSMFLLLAVFVFNLWAQINLFLTNPIDFLSDTTQLISSSMIFAVLLYEVYALAAHLVWRRRSARAIADGGAYVETTGRAHKIVEVIILCAIACFFCVFLLDMAWKGSWFPLLVGAAQIPILTVAFRFSIKYLKKKKASAMVNRVVSFSVLILAAIAYLSLIMVLIIRFEFPAENRSDHRTVTWQLTATESHDYNLYCDDIPLTCEALYGQTDYDYYSYEGEVDRSIFLTRSSYRQDSLPAKDSPPELRYEILEPRFEFVYHLISRQLLKAPEWRPEYRFRPIGNGMFGTVAGYQVNSGDIRTGKYILFYEDKIITFELEEPPTPEQVAVIKEKLLL